MLSNLAVLVDLVVLLVGIILTWSDGPFCMTFSLSLLASSFFFYSSVLLAFSWSWCLSGMSWDEVSFLALTSSDA